MPTLDQRLRLLEPEPPPATRAALLEALRYATPDERGRICLALARDPHPDVVSALLQTLRDLPPDEADAVTAAIPDLRPAIPRILQSDDAAARLTLLDLIAARGDVRAAAATIPPILCIDDADLADRAEQAALAVTVAAVGPRGRKRLSIHRRRTLEALILESLEQAARRRGDRLLLAAALLAVRPGPLLADILDQPQHPLHFAMRGVAERLDEPGVRRNLLNWLGTEALRGPAARWIHRIEGLEAWSDLLSGGHLLLHPRRRPAARRIDRPVRCVPDLTLATALLPTTQARLPQLISGLDLSADLRVRRLADLIALTAPVARWQALLALLRQHAPRAERAVEQFCFDRCGFIARLATQHRLTLPGAMPEPALEALAGSGHDWVAARARSILAGRSINAFFAGWLDLPAPARLASAHRLASTAPDELRAQLATRLPEGPRRSRLAAIDLIRHVGLVPELEEAIITLTADPDSRIASAAAAALADGTSPGRLPALLTALRHDDARVRANAIETLMRAGGRAAAELVRPLTRCPDNRPRANAVRAVLRAQPADGESELKTMLTDKNPLHRISGLWVARRTPAAAAQIEIKHLATSDRVPEIRSRASAVLRFLLASTAGAGAEPQSPAVAGR